jgi:triosephosphate isomerase
MTSRKPLIAGNWKMYKTGQEARESAATLAKLIADVTEPLVMIAPPFTALSAVAEVVLGTNIALGAQNLYWEPEGAFTGEISTAMLKAAGCRYVIIGHSERRQYFGESDQNVNRKIKAAVAADMIPVMCIGETEAEREADETFSVLDKQVKIGLEGLFSDDLINLVVAYEPVWAIGTGKTATSDQAQEVHRFLRELLAKQFDQDFADAVRILYGGSVKPNNIAELMAMEDIDGALVGGASLDAETFSQIVKYP